MSLEKAYDKTTRCFNSPSKEAGCCWKVWATSCAESRPCSEQIQRKFRATSGSEGNNCPRMKGHAQIRQNHRASEAPLAGFPVGLPIKSAKNRVP